METWQEILSDSVDSYQGLRDLGLYDGPDLESRVYINPYLLDLILREGAESAIGKQFIPNTAETVVSPVEMVDSLSEDVYAHGSLVHKYPDRALLLISGHCAGLCRFCTRKRKVLMGSARGYGSARFHQALDYLSRHEEITDLLVSGGDPFLCSDDFLEEILRSLRRITHLKVIRIGTRTPSVLPQRITPRLCRILKKYGVKYINTHFNHPTELTPETVEALEKLRLAGISIGSQTVLLKGINDDIETMRSPMMKLYHNGVRSYYVYHADLVVGTSHFRTTLKEGMEIMHGLQGWISGMAVPRYVFDSPIGKVPVTHEYIKEKMPGVYEIKDYRGKIFLYFENEEGMSSTCSSTAG